MQVWCFRNVDAAAGYAPDDILLFAQPAVEVGSYLGILKELIGPYADVYCVNTGGKNYSPYVLAKHLQYTRGANGVTIVDFSEHPQVVLFRIWEDLCSAIADLHPDAIRLRIGLLESHLHAEPFFAYGHRLIHALKRYTNTAHPDVLPDCLERYTFAVRDVFSYPAKAALVAAATSLAAASIDLSSSNITIRTHVDSLRDFLQTWDRSRTHQEAFTYLSCCAYYRAEYALGKGDCNQAILLCHRALDLFFAGLCRKLADANTWGYMLEKYEKLVDAGVLARDPAVKKTLDDLNECRNKCFLGHGTWTVGQGMASTLVSETKTAIQKTEGTPSRWTHAQNKLRRPNVALADIFAFEDDPTLLLEKVVP